MLGHRKGLHDLMIADRDRFHAPIIGGLDIFFDIAHAVHFGKIGVDMPFDPFFFACVFPLFDGDLFDLGDHEGVCL